jgi:hypothetical protein
MPPLQISCSPPSFIEFPARERASLISAGTPLNRMMRPSPDHDKTEQTNLTYNLSQGDDTT